MYSADILIEKFALVSHPEGGYYKETYRASGNISDSVFLEKYSGSRDFSTSIYFLLNAKDVSKFHRLKSDELWFFHLGSAVRIHVIGKNGEYHNILLGDDINAKENLQAVIPGGCWFGAEMVDKTSFSFMSCVVSPGFDFNDFELATRKELISEYPQYSDIIKRLT